MTRHDYAAASRAWPGNTFRLGLAIEQRGRSWTTYEAWPLDDSAFPVDESIARERSSDYVMRNTEEESR